MEYTKEAQDFFQVFRNVRNEIADENGYHLAKAMMLAYDRYNQFRNGMPDFDGKYLVLIEQEQDCGNIWQYQQVVDCIMNTWILKDKEKVIGWKYLSTNTIKDLHEKAKEFGFESINRECPLCGNRYNEVVV
jgi:hypothetical protein